jgi:murein DD-endopeptidase MepM/ murein hydrolase activator NlpD
LTARFAVAPPLAAAPIIAMSELFERAQRRATDLLTRHRRWAGRALGASLALFGIAAFGIAPLAPDAARLPQRMIVEAVPTPNLSAQLEALIEQPLELSRSDLTRIGDTVDSVLRRLGVDDAAASSFIRTDVVARRVVEGRSVKTLQARADATGHLQELVARFAVESGPRAATHFNRLRINRVHDYWTVNLDEVPFATEVKLGSGTIQSSLFAASDDAGIPDSIATQMAEVFAGDFDLHRQLRRGDTFAVVYETLTADGEPVSWGPASGRVLAAEFTNGGLTHTAVWFRDPNGNGGYYDPTGRSKRRPFLVSPLEFSRVTSGFATRRHPILQTWRQHLGVDYAAPSGTVVRSVGNGTIEFAGWQNGYGNVIKIDHGKQRQTVYAHLSRIDVQDGQRIEQGQRIGAVGATGWATGPHLHFEFRINGEHHDPAQMAQGSDPLNVDAKAQREFALVAQGARSQLDAALSIRGAQAE